MTTHLFLLKDPAQTQQQFSMFSLLLPNSLMLERSQKRLNVKQELGQDKVEPYICFTEQSGMVVLITFTGMCLKYTLSICEQNPQLAPTQE
jgi:hypothetical protein